MNHSYCKRDMNGELDRRCQGIAVRDLRSELCIERSVLYCTVLSSCRLPMIILGILAYFTPKGNVAPSDLFPSSPLPYHPRAPQNPSFFQTIESPLHVSSSIYGLFFVP